jgi:hypothetical protein
MQPFAKDDARCSDNPHGTTCASEAGMVAVFPEHRCTDGPSKEEARSRRCCKLYLRASRGSVPRSLREPAMKPRCR